ncbi:MAG: aminotransferase class III-fold pyridoxal phosphate-dependent enzyme, partial [Candidatus Heimdallarchaeota archaeon]
WDTTPDIIASGKGLSSGYFPIAATVASDKVFEAFREPFAHGHTYISHPVGCAAGYAVLDYVVKHNLVERSAELGKYFHERLQELCNHPTVGDVRGIGLFTGIEFVKDKETKEPFHPELKYYSRIMDQCFKNLLLVYPGSGTVDGVRGDHIIVAPPLIVERSEIDEIVEILDRSISEAEEKVAR